jgi:GTPase SAR1 family protein
MQGDDFEVNAPTGTTPRAGNGSNSSSSVLLQREIKVLVVGNGNVGKSSMIKRLCK